MRFSPGGFDRSTAWMQEIEAANGTEKVLPPLASVKAFYR